MATGFELLTQGNLFDAFFQPFIDMGISQSLVLTIIFMFGITAMYIKTRSVELIGLSTMLFAPVVLVSAFAEIPLISKYLLVVIVVGFSYVLYKLFR